MVGRVLATAMAATLLLLPVTAAAQTVEGGVSLSTPFPGLVVEPGDTATFSLRATGEAGARSSLQLSGLPDTWEARFLGERTTIEQVAIAAADTPVEVELEVTVPAEAEEGVYEFEARAGSFRLPLAVTVRAGVAGEVTLTPDFPGLRGPADSEFQFQVTLRNDTPGEVQLELGAFGPEGWQVTAEPAGEAQAAAITVDSGGTETINLTAQAPVDAQAGTYEVGMTATGEGVEAELTVIVELIGQLSLDITTPDQRLNAEVTIGQATEFPIVVFNDGTAPLVGVSITTRPPSNWEVTVEPSTIDLIEPGQVANVTAVITPAANALAGDYDLTFTASSETESDSMSIRTTVNPSAFWGIVGVGLIALTLAGLALVFRRFGRR